MKTIVYESDVGKSRWSNTFGIRANKSHISNCIYVKMFTLVIRTSLQCISLYVFKEVYTKVLLLTKVHFIPKEQDHWHKEGQAYVGRK